jgi:tetratricopeptide (TPR) repeat protein
MARLWLFSLVSVALLSAQSLVQQGLQALQRGDLPQARTVLEQASRSDPVNPFIWSALAEVYLRSHEPALAASAAQSAEKNGQNNPVVDHALAMYYSEAGDFSRAGKLEGQFAASPKADRNAAARAAGFYLQANDPAAALPLAERAAQVDPQTAFQLAQAFLERQDSTQAAEVLVAALGKFPSDAQLTLALGVARYGQRRFGDALDLFLKVIELAPNVEQPYSFIGRMLDQAGPRLPRIEEIFAKRANSNPENAQAQFLFAKVLLTANNQDPNAEPLLRKSIALEPDRWESHYELGALLAARHDYPGAAKELTRSIELNPKQANAHYQLARVYDRLGEPEKAKEQREIHRQLTSAGGAGMQ